MVPIITAGILLVAESILLTALGIFLYSETFTQTGLSWHYPTWLLAGSGLSGDGAVNWALLFFLLISIVFIVMVIKSTRKWRIVSYSQLTFFLLTVIVVLPVAVSGAIQSDSFRRDQLLSQAKSGNIVGIVALATAYEKGLYGFPRDITRAAAMFVEAGKAGSGEAAYKVARLHLAGEGLMLSKCRALRWFFMAVDQQYFAAFYDLGRMYAAGDCLKIDPIMAAACLVAFGKMSPEDPNTATAMKETTALQETLAEEDRKTVVSLSSKLVELARNRTLLKSFYPDDRNIGNAGGSLVIQEDN